MPDLVMAVRKTGEHGSKAVKKQPVLLVAFATRVQNAQDAIYTWRPAKILYKLALKEDRVLPTEPIFGVAAWHGTLKLSAFVPNENGPYHFLSTFRYQNKRFELIGYDHSARQGDRDWVKGDPIPVDFSANFLTEKIKFRYMNSNFEKTGSRWVKFSTEQIGITNGALTFRQLSDPAAFEALDRALRATGNL
ncbi:hypothetical protein AWV80_34500 [Cupriavidus sp. UYMU48A]|nr:hypothetical protein AWV80_34500 [Cupriavidus sp. UYMU48A]